MYVLDCRFAATRLLHLSVLIAVVLVLGLTVSGQKSSWSQQNADGTSTKVELLPGGGARATTTDTGSNVKDTVTTVPNSKYGEGGSKVTVQGADANKNDIDIEVYRDAAGKVRELHYTSYGQKDKYGQKHEFNAKYDEKGELKSYEKKLNNKGGGDKAYPPSGGDKEGISDEAAKYKEVAEDITKARFGTDAPGLGAATKVDQPTLSPTEKSADSGEAKPSRTPSDKPADPKTPENRKTPKLPVSQPTIVPGDIVKYLTNVKEATGLYTVQFTAPNKDILEVYLPRHLFPGANLGSVHVIPSKATDGGLSFKDDKLQIGDQSVPIEDRRFRCDYKLGDLGKFRVIDSKGHSLGGIDFPITDVQEHPTVRGFPTSATFGELMELDFPSTPNPVIAEKGPEPFAVKIGDQEMPIIVANGLGLVTREDYNHAGLTTLQMKIGEDVFTAPFRVLTLKLSAGNLNLLKHQSTTVHIIAGGLEDLKADANMAIAASGVVTMTGATSVEIDPKMVAADGTYTTDRSLYAEEAGTFNVTVTVKVGKEPWNEKKTAETKTDATENGNAGGSTKTSEKKQPSKTVDKKVSIEDAEKRIKPLIDYIDKRAIQMAVIYRRADGAKETLEDAFKKSGVKHSMSLADEMAKTGLGQFWSDEGGPTYARCSEIFQRYLDVIRKEGSTRESYLDSIDQAMEAWKQFDKQFGKQMQKLVELYTKEASQFDELHAVDVKYADQLEELLKKDPRPKKEIDELRKKEEAEAKGVRDGIQDTQKEIDKAKTEARALADFTKFLQPK